MKENIIVIFILTRRSLFSKLAVIFPIEDVLLIFVNVILCYACEKECNVLELIYEKHAISRNT